MKGKPGLNISAPAEYVSGQSVLREISDRSPGARLFLVGGAVRDCLIGRVPTDVDLVVEGDALKLAFELDPDATVHERFMTAEVDIDGESVHLASARSEKYAHPGSLPEVIHAGLLKDLERRDFSINAMAVALDDPEVLIDPMNGLADLERRVLRVLHAGSFVEDPTRAFRAARYSARLGFDLDHRTNDLLADVDLSTVSTERVEAELRLIAGEQDALKALSLVSQWGILEIEPERLELAAKAIETAEAEPWSDLCPRDELILKAIHNLPEALQSLSKSEPKSPSQAVLLAGKFDECDLLLARASGCGWLDRYREEWSKVELEIGGDDLIRAGIPTGPAIGRGLDAALAAKLDGGAGGHGAELEIAIAAARA